jgi:hypothetical protein
MIKTTVIIYYVLKTHTKNPYYVSMSLKDPLPNNFIMLLCRIMTLNGDVPYLSYRIKKAEGRAASLEFKADYR